MRNFRIETRLAIGFAIVIAIAAAFGAFAYIQLAKTDETASLFARIGWPAAHASEDLRSSVQKQYALFERMLNTSDRSEVSRLDSRIVAESLRSAELVAKLQSFPSNEQQQRSFEALKSVRDSYMLAFNAAVGLIKSGTDEARVQALELDTQNIQLNYAKYLAQADALVAVTRSAAQEQMQRKDVFAPISDTRLLAYLAAAILLSVVIAVLIIQSIVEPISNAIQALHDVAKGDLTRRAEVTSNDQLGHLLSSINGQLDSHGNSAGIAERLAEGDLTVQVGAPSAKDMLGRALLRMRNNLQASVESLEKLAEGNLSVQPRMLSDKDRLGGSLIKLRDFLRDSSEAAKEIAEGGSAASLIPLSPSDVLRNSLVQLRNSRQVSTQIALKFAKGDLLGDLPATKGSDKLGQLLSKAQQNLAANLAIVEKVSAGDLTVRALPSSDDRLSQALEHMLENLRHMISGVVVSASNIASVSADLNANALQLLQNSDQHTAASSEAQSIVNGMALGLQQSADNSEFTESLVAGVAKDGEMGGAAMGQTIEAGKELAEKLVLFEEIARRNDLMTLAAAVEAAKAGEHGTGFAVIAAELRKLAERSQIASADILRLMSGNVKVAQSAGEILAKFAPGITRTVDLVRQSASASAEQNGNAARANKAVQQLDTVIQQNVFASRQMVAVAEHMADEAKALDSRLSLFKLPEASPEAENSAPPLVAMQKSAAG